MADVHGSPGAAPQMPQAGGPGSAPVPYGGPDLQPEPPGYDPGPVPLVDHVTDMVHGYQGPTGAPEQPWAHDTAAGAPDAPYYPGPLAPINAAGDDDAGGRDDVAGSVQQAVANASGRWHELMGDNGTAALAPGMASDKPVHAGTIGDLIHFPPSPLDPGAGVGNTTPTGDFYDPPRDYGGAEGAPSYGGGEQGLPGEQGKAL